MFVADIDDGRQKSDRACRAVAHTADSCQALDLHAGVLLQLTRASHQQSMRVREIVRAVVPAVVEQDHLVQQLADTCDALQQEGDALRLSLDHVTPRD